jgi:hypothetical protein
MSIGMWTYHIATSYRAGRRRVVKKLTDIEVLNPSLAAGVASRIEVLYVGKRVTHALPTVA